MTARQHPAVPLRYKRSGSEKRQRASGADLVRLLPDERATLEGKSREVGLSLAAFLRACSL